MQEPSSRCATGLRRHRQGTQKRFAVRAFAPFLSSVGGLCLIAHSLMSSKPKQAGAGLSFESAMDRLESIVEKMESGKLPLEELIVRYEEGMNLVKICQERLASAEQKIEIITRNGAGKPVLKDFEPAAEAKTEPREDAAVASENQPKNDDVSLF